MEGESLRVQEIKLAVWVERSVRRIVLYLPTSFPWLRTWRQLARGRRDDLRRSGNPGRRVTAGSVSLSAAPLESAPTSRWAIRPSLSRRRAEIDSSLGERVPTTRWGLTAILDVHVRE